MPNTTAIQASLLSEQAAQNEDYKCSPGSVYMPFNGAQGTWVDSQGIGAAFGG